MTETQLSENETKAVNDFVENLTIEMKKKFSILMENINEKVEAINHRIDELQKSIKE